MYPPLPNPSTEPGAPVFGEQDIVLRSASSVPAPTRELTPVAKLIDVSKCIG
ncbi:MAG TPA: formate dehydrogenase subunit beta, partial [Roseiarcus sp.]|nr:formate dehydrogenase subunit beta [Roseiarcus sp.]